VTNNGGETGENVENPDALLVRSAKLHDIALPSHLKAIGRAGAGVNNIPVERCSNEGIVVFNTPGANANAVKELIIGSLFLASRNIVKGSNFAHSIIDKGSEVPAIIEKNKSTYKGSEVKGKTLGVIGLGAIGMMVANDAVNLGMNVQGFDPYISVDHAWGLSRQVKPADNIDKLLAEADFISLNTPLTDTTRNFLNKAKLEKLKQGCVILNFARGEIVEEGAMIEALISKKVGYYVTDFPTAELLKLENTIGLPHLGASTNEAEDNCAYMISEQVYDYLVCGNITNSINFPDCRMDRNSSTRITIANRNIPQMVSKITAVLGQESLNISEMLNKSKGDLAYNIVDIEGEVSEELISKIKAIEGVMRVRVLS